MKGSNRLNHYKKVRAAAWVSILLAAFNATIFSTTSHAADLAIVIDDIGHNRIQGNRAVQLPGEVTIAVLPFAPFTSSLVAQAQALGKEVIIHQPMEHKHNPSVPEEVGTLKLHMHDVEFDLLIERSLNAVPQTAGLSNHTGSLLTQHSAPMARVMAQLSKRGLYFLDSRTTAETVALDVARALGVPAVRRDVFLDHERNYAAIDAAFEKSLAIARRNGHAVLVGHPYSISLDYLERRLANLPSDIRLVPAADLATAIPENASEQNPASNSIGQ